MEYSMISMPLYFSVVLLLLLSFNSGNNAKSSSCGVTREENTIVDIKKSRATSNTTRAVKGLNLTDEILCRDECCSNTECTVYVYYNSKQRQFNCFLIKCEPVNKCVRSTLKGSVVGTLKRNPLAGNAIQPSQITSFKSMHGVTLETSITQTPIDTSPTAMEQPAQRGMTPSPINMSTPGTSPSVLSSVATSAQSPTASTHVIHTSHANTSTHKQSTTKSSSAQHNHTNKTSLVIALFFGLLFLVAVIIIVGRPWWEFVQRPRYSKVDYLMNGL